MVSVGWLFVLSLGTPPAAVCEAQKSEKGCGGASKRRGEQESGINSWPSDVDKKFPAHLE